MILPLLSGVLIGTSYIPFPPWAGLFCFIPLWLHWAKQKTLKKVFLAGCLTAFVFTLIGFNWVAYLLHEFAHLNWFFSVLGLLLFALVAHLYVPIAGMVWFLLDKKMKLSGFSSYSVMALVTALCEHYSITLFDWNFGYSWYAAAVPIYQIAEWVGFSGLSSLVILFNLLFLLAWRQRRNNEGKMLFMLALIFFASLNGLGVMLKQRLQEPGQTLSVLMIQGNIGNEEKMAAEIGRGFRTEIIRNYLRLTENAINKADNETFDFILWPEAAFPDVLDEQFSNRYHQQVLSHFIRQINVPLITGAFSFDNATRKIGNSLFIVSNDGKIVPEYYTKSILLAFGEYIPGERWFPEIRQWLPPIGRFKRGTGAQVINWNDFVIGAQICYEGLFPAYSRLLANQGAQFLVNLTNDSWYGSWQEPYQHFYMTLARAIEFRRPVIRVTNTGISSVALANGEILARSPLHQVWTGHYAIPYAFHPQATFYQTWFYLVPGVLWGALFFGIIMNRWFGFKTEHRKNTTNPL